MNVLRKWFCCAALLFSFACSGNESLKAPSWIKIMPNGTFEIDDIRVAIGVNDGRRGASETAANSKFEKAPGTIELDSRIWQTRFRPFSPGPFCTLQKKLTLFSDSELNWRYTFLGAEGSGIRGVGVDLTMPAVEREFIVDGKKVPVPAKFTRVVLYRGKCRILRIPVAGSEVEFSGELDLTISDLRKWGAGTIIITFTMKELHIDGNALKGLFPPEKIGGVLDKLFHECLYDGSRNDRTKLLREARRLSQKEE